MLRRLCLGVTLAISQMLVAREFVDIYRNPVVDYSLPDPSVVKAEDGYYYLYITGNTYIPAYRSTNLTDWQELGPVFTPARDAWSVHNLWAPEVVAKDGKYYMYYSGRNAYSSCLHWRASRSFCTDT